MTDDDQRWAQHRTADQEHWNGETPEALLSRLGKAPEVGSAMLDVGAALRGAATGRMLELVALRVSAKRDCAYTWRGHCRIALKSVEAPMTREEIARIAAGPEALVGTDRLVLEAVDEILGRGRLSEATGRSLGDRELVLTIAVCFYETLATVMHGVEPDAQSVIGLETPRVAANRGWR